MALIDEMLAEAQRRAVQAREEKLATAQAAPEAQADAPDVDAPQPGTVYRLTGGGETASILRGDGWADSAVKPEAAPEAAEPAPRVYADSQERCADCGGYLPALLVSAGILNCAACQDESPTGDGPDRITMETEMESIYAGEIAAEEACGIRPAPVGLPWNPSPPAPRKWDARRRGTQGEPRVLSTSNKRGAFWLVVLPYVKGLEFSSRIARARTAGGWYSRKWSTSPAGFGFRSDGAAREFLASELDGGA